MISPPERIIRPARKIYSNDRILIRAGRVLLFIKATYKICVAPSDGRGLDWRLPRTVSPIEREFALTWVQQDAQPAPPAGQLLGRQGQAASARRLAPGEQMLRRDLVPTRDLRCHRSGRVGFRDDPALVLRAPATAAPNPDPDIDTTAPLRTVNYMVNHICEPISPNRFASCRSPRAVQGGAKGPLTLQQVYAVISMC